MFRILKILLGGQQMMQLLLQDVFRDTISKTKQLGMWEKMTISQKEALVRKYLLEYYAKCVTTR
jgi:hypothetical protein